MQPTNRTYPLLARALGAQGDFRKLQSELAGRKLEDPAARAELARLAVVCIAGAG